MISRSFIGGRQKSRIIHWRKKNSRIVQWRKEKWQDRSLVEPNRHNWSSAKVCNALVIALNASSLLAVFAENKPKNLNWWIARDRKLDIYVARVRGRPLYYTRYPRVCFRITCTSPRSTRIINERFQPQRPSGQVEVTGAFPSPSRHVPSFLSRIGFIIPPTVKLFVLVDSHQTSRTRALALSACQFVRRRKCSLRASNLRRRPQ